MYLNDSQYNRDRRRRRLRLWLLLALAYASVALAWYNKQREVPLFAEAPTPTIEQTVEEEALSEYEQIVERADLYFNQGNITAALESYEEAVAADPNQPTAYARWAKLLSLRYRVDEALVRSERALTLAPEEPEAIAARALALTWDEQYPEAIQMAQQAVALAPEYGEAHGILARAYVETEAYTQAAESAQRAIDLSPDDVWTWFHHGYVYESLAEYEEALASYQEAIDIVPLSSLYNSIGRLHLYTEVLSDIDAAIAAFQEATYVDPRNPEAYAELARLYIFQEDTANAKVYALQGIEQDPSFSLNHSLLGQIYYQELNFEGAISSLEQAISFGSENPTNYIYLGLAHAYLEQCDEAVPWLQRALEAYPDSGPVHTGLQICGVEPPPAADPPPAP